jgi:hypothetical protein
MTANKFNIGDAVRWNKSKIKFKVIALEKDCVRINYYNNTNDYVSQLVFPRDLSAWSDKLHCLYCGAEIVIEDNDIIETACELEGLFYEFIDNSKHADKCPLKNGFGYNTKQEAIDAYSMKWEG